MCVTSDIESIDPIRVLKRTPFVQNVSNVLGDTLKNTQRQFMVATILPS